MATCEELEQEVLLWRRYFAAQHESRLFGGIIYIPEPEDPDA